MVFRLHGRQLAILLPILIVFNLGASFLGSLFILAYWFLLSLIIFSVGYTWLFAFKFHLSQSFSNDHPMKGEVVNFKIRLRNPFFLPSPSISLSFTSIQEDLGQELPPLYLNLRSNELREIEHEVRIPWRGIYTVGMGGILIHDYLGLVSFDLDVWHRTFYVYPRKIKIKEKLGFNHGSYDNDLSLSRINTTTDLFSSLKEYRQGQSIRQIAWKKFASTGSIYLKEFDSEQGKSIGLLLDETTIRSDRLENTSKQEIEDLALEAMIGFVSHSLERKRSIYLEHLDTSIKDQIDFDSFYRSCISFRFTEESFNFHRSLQSTDSNRTTIIITALNDLNILDKDFLLQNPHTIVVAILVGFRQEESLEILNYIDELMALGIRFQLIHTEDDIESELWC